MILLIRKKLNSRRGASLGVALLLTLICLLFSASILAFSTASNAGTVKADDNDRAYYLTASALDLMAECFSNKTITYYDGGELGLGTYAVQSDSELASAIILSFAEDGSTSQSWPISITYDGKTADIGLTIECKDIYFDPSLTITVTSISYDGKLLPLSDKTTMHLAASEVRHFNEMEDYDSLECRYTTFTYAPASIQKARW